MKKTLSLIIAILVFSSIATAQRYTIKGKILDAISKEKIPDSSISLHYKTDTLGIYKGIRADTNGDFEIKNVRKRDMILKGITMKLQKKLFSMTGTRRILILRLESVTLLHFIKSKGK